MGSTSDCKAQAAILAIGTANPPNFVYQDDYPDYFFRVMNASHLTDLKDKFTRICKQSGTRKRHFLLTEEILKRNPAICSYDAASLDQRQDLVIDMHPKLAMEAANKAIAEWGRPKSAITHLIFCSIAGVDMPGADIQLLRLLDLPPSVNRLMLYNLGCYAGGTLLRLAKDIAENNPGARVLGVCVETTVPWFRAPAPQGDPVYLVGSAIFGDGAGAVIVGSPPLSMEAERRIFEITFASQTTIPGSDEAVGGQCRRMGTTMRLSPELPKFVSSNLEACLVKALGQSKIVVGDWNSIFWAIHPGGRKILDYAEAKFGLRKERLRAARHVLEEYGNMSSASVVFILDEIRRKSVEEGKSTTGEGLEWGVHLGFGPGITIETVVLRSLPLSPPAAVTV